MTRGADWYSFHATINPIDTAAALQAALADPQQRWYALRRIQALTVNGAITAAAWNPNVHPRGRDGKFIEKFGWVRWFDAGDLTWRTGWVSDIDGANGKITVRSGGDKLEFPNAKSLYARPKPKALLDLPDPVNGTAPDKFNKVGGQGGSNPGALYEIDGSFANGSPDITKQSKMFQSIRTLRQPGTVTYLSDTFDAAGLPESVVPNEVDTIVIPRVDGTLNRYDVLQRFGTKWYRVPADGQMTVDDMMRPELEVSPADAFGHPGSPRRALIHGDLGTMGITRGSAYDVEDVADMIQQTGSPLPKVGDRYYVKKMNIPERARSEALANDYYELLGIPVPEVAVGSDGTTISSKLLAAGDKVKFDENNPAHIKAAQEGFLADAWLANWDVIGKPIGDNIQIDSDGRAWRIDAGGSLEWRAMGKPKGAAFGDNVGELDSLRNVGLNPSAGKVFGGISNDDLVAQATLLQSITPADIQNLADIHDMSHVGPVMIARRKSILDQLGIIDPPPTAPNPDPTPKTVYNPVEAIQQVGAPPTVAVHNWNVTMKAQPSQTVDAVDWDHDQIHDVVWKKDGDLWVYNSDLTETSDGDHRGLFRNVFTGEIRPMYLYTDQDEYLTGSNKNNVDNLVDDLGPDRDLAIAEVVARTTHTPLDGLATWNVNEADDPDFLTYGNTQIGSWPGLEAVINRGRLGKDHDRPLMDADGNLWEITTVPKFDLSDGDIVTLSRRTGGIEQFVHIPAANWKSSGPWYMPNNDTTAAVWMSKYDPINVGGDQDALGIGLDMDSKIAAKLNAWEDSLGMLGPDGGINIPGGDDGNLSNLEAEEAVAQAMKADQDIEDWMVMSEPTVSQKIVHGVAAGFSPSEPILSTEMDVADLDAISAQLLNKPVIILPIESYENPDWPGENLGDVNGLGIVTQVSTKKMWDYSTTPAKTKDVIMLKVSKPYKGYTWVVAGESASWKKVVIPVETMPEMQQVTFKKNGDIVINGTTVGTYDGYNGVIDGDHSLTGGPLHFSSSTKTGLKNAATSLVAPIPPPPAKKKSAKELATEQKIKDLNDALTATQTAITSVEQQLAGLATAEPAGEGNPLNDGSKPAKGDWVFSLKDGTYAQVLNPNVVGFAGKGVLSPDMIKVKIQDPATGKWKQSNRKREQLVSVAGPGEAPFVLSTKALKGGDQSWIGPGVDAVYAPAGQGMGSNVKVLDTTTDGKVKIALSDGSEKWVSNWSMSTPAGHPGATLKTPTGGNLDQAKADWLNSELDALNDQHAKLVTTIAATLATPSVAKKKKPIGVPYPGPEGSTFKQPPWLAESRTAKGLKNMKDGYVPTAGMIIRHNDGTQYIVYRTGDDWSSHKNSVYVAPANNPTAYKWRSLATMVVDHEAMLTDKAGEPMPIISEVEGADWTPDTGIVLSKPFTKEYWYQNPITGAKEWREKSYNRYFIVGYDGTVYYIDGSKASAAALEPTYNSPNPPERIGYIDKSHPGGKKLTMSLEKGTGQSSGTYIQYAVIHDSNTPAAIPLAKQSTAAPTPQATPVQGPVPPATIPGTNFVAPPTTPGPAAPTPPPPPTSAAPAPAAPPTPNLPTTVSPTPTDELPVFTGVNPSGMEVPHPPTTSSTKAVPVFQPQGGTPTLDVAGLTGAHSVTDAVAQTLDIAKSNKANGEKKWVGTYGIADHDMIEDMMVRTQTIRDAQGVEYVEVSFRLDIPAARSAHNTFMTSSKNEMGDWQPINRNATNLVPGDLLAVRTASGGHATPAGALRPDENGKMPTATVVAAPVLIGKNKAYGSTAAGTYDVYRTQVMTANGDIGFIDVEDRNGQDSLIIFEWDPTIARTTSGAKSLNPNAKDDGWTVKSSVLSWASTGGWQKSDLNPDGTKKAPTTFETASPYRTDTTPTMPFGDGAVLQRDYQGVHIEYATAPKKNSLDGHTVIRVRADDPEAQRKISEAMELVGVTKEKQLPPDKAALTKLATDKVFEQFNANYTRGKTPNSPQEAIDAIDKAVGEYMPGKRKATMDDISVRVSADGRVQVLVSEDVSRAIVKKNGVKQYVHTFMAKEKLNMVEAIMAGESSSILASTERFQHGLWWPGMSSGKDHGHDSADHVFLHMDKNGGKAGEGSVTIDAVTLHRHVDYYFQPGDRYGERESNQLNWLNGPSGGELMLQRRFEPDLMTYITLSSADRAKVIKKLHDRGIFNAPNGKPLEEFLLDAKPSTPPPVNFGDEVTLNALPETAAPTLVAV